MKSFANKVAAITGAGSGIGRALAYELCAAGAEVALCDVNEDGLEQTVARCRELGAKVTHARVDVADREAVYAWADRVVADHGRVNLIFNNAGVALGCTLEGVDYDDFEWIMNINFWGVVYGTKAFLPHLRASGDGHVINTSSVFGLIAVAGNGTYNATKFAVRGFTEALRQELEITGAPVSATCVHPGGIKTNIVKAARYHESTAALVGGDIEANKVNFEKSFITKPETAAKVILDAVRRNRRRVLVGPDARVIDWVQRTLPSAYQYLSMAVARRQGKR
ncbi:SDR family NAD(P)-dependent oxidoreductase [Paraliomyxa miuraensis]|uniref:SDR family NAD(P)-dependent oxidoreductase n=1 Tax=Paraliomyxa miuraensis TaxID=376150 RepID=UPI002252FC0E|nr:SDR family oxidoreductase [Paraliomyxa miuraensis]MCX4246736.1 SDR family oxidoreductase [Paraliomyxa miuraensis]